MRRLTDPGALAARRARWDGSADFLQVEALDEIQERLRDVNRTFTAPAVVTARPEIWAAAAPDARVVPDGPVLDLSLGAHDLIIHAMCLHWADDPLGQLIQCRRALRPDGLLLAVLPGGETLAELRTALGQAEVELRGGLSPRVAPMAEIREIGALLQRAGFALPVADMTERRVRYRDLPHLMHDLRAMGEGNALADRDMRPPPRELFARADRIYAEAFPDGAGIRATFQTVFLTGWAPSPDQPKALRPGSATTRLADALGTTEITAADAAARTGGTGDDE